MKMTKMMMAGAIALGGFVETALPVDAAEKRISVEEFRDRMEGAWLGQSVAVAYGWPTEFKYVGRTVPESELPVWKPEMVNNTYEQDDLYVEMTFLHTLETRGIDVSCRQAGIDFANSTYRLWCANANARDLLRKGIAAPASGSREYHPTPDDIDYQIESDFSGIISPGLPARAVKLGEQFGRIMNSGDGLYAGQFMGGMYSAAYFERDRVKTVEAGLKCIPSDSKYAMMVRDMLKWYKENPQNWQIAWTNAVEKYGRKDSPMIGKVSFAGIDVKINGAMVLLGYLWGEGDPWKTTIIATRGGYDSDCNPSSALGVLGVQLGAKNFPKDMTEGLDKSPKWEFTDYDWAGLMKVSEKLARQIVVAEGGRIEVTDGKEYFVIPDGGQSGPAVWGKPPYREEVHYAEAEMAEILYEPCNGHGKQSVLKGRLDLVNAPFNREKIEWFDFWVEEADVKDSKLPRVLLIGDSISRQYRGGVSKRLKGKAMVANAAGSRCVGDPAHEAETKYVLSLYDWDVIHFNNGHHGAALEDDKYGPALKKWIELIRKLQPKAKLIWATTTHTTDKWNERAQKRNAAAAEVLKAYPEIAIDDLNKLSSENPDLISADHIHFTPAGCDRLADAVAASIEKELGK